MRQKIITRLKLIAENAAAISDRVHSNPDQYHQLYGRMGESLGGFPGIWSLIADCALELDEQHPEEWEDGWIEACWAVGDLILAMETSTPVSELVGRAIHSKQITHAANVLPDLVKGIEHAIEALYNVPEVGMQYDQQHSDTHLAAVVELKALLAKS